MAPMVHGLEAKYYGKVKFSYLDASDPNTQDFQRALGFRYQPEFYLLDGQGNLLEAPSEGGGAPSAPEDAREAEAEELVSEELEEDEGEE